MPRISEFFGIVIRMIYNDHMPSHFYAEYAGQEAVFRRWNQPRYRPCPYLHGPIFQPICDDPAVFRSVRIDGGALAWDNGADIDPDVLYYNLAPAWKQEHLTPDHR